MNSKFSRRQLMQGAGGIAGLAAASRLTGPLLGNAYAQATPAKSALLVIFLQGGYNSVFPSADSYRGAGTFGVTGDNIMKGLGNGLVVDNPTFGTLPAYALSHMSSVGIRHGITAHGAAQNADFTDGSRSYVLKLADAMGGEAAIKAVQVGNRNVPGPKPAENGVSLQVINDMKSTIAALGGASDATIPNRDIAANGIKAAHEMSQSKLTVAPNMLVTLDQGYKAGEDTLRKPVKPFDFNELATAYALGANQTAVNSFKAEIAAAELMITAGANVVCALDGGWDTHGDRTGANVRNMMNTRILPPLKVFLNRMMNRPDYNVVVTIMGDFARSLPGSDHASALTATVIGKNVKVGTTGKMSDRVQLPAGTPSNAGYWAYLSKVLGVTATPFGNNPHTGLVV